MNTASLDLCKELYELSGWDVTVDKTWINYRNVGNNQYFQMVTNEFYSEKDETHICPAYDLGYLLRKLPGNSWVGYTGVGMDDSVHGVMGRGYAVAYVWLWDESIKDVRKQYDQNADTTEDAACSLAIALFKEGILTKA